MGRNRGQGGGGAHHARRVNATKSMSTYEVSRAAHDAFGRRMEARQCGTAADASRRVARAACGAALGPALRVRSPPLVDEVLVEFDSLLCSWEPVQGEPVRNWVSPPVPLLPRVVGKLRDFFFAPWFLRCCLIADACRASAAGLARSRCCWLRLHRQWVAATSC